MKFLYQRTTYFVRGQYLSSFTVRRIRVRILEPKIHQFVSLLNTSLTFFLGFNVQDEAIEFLKTLKGPMGIVAVAGMYRTGKSYLLNRMILNRQSGFGVGPTINPCTKVRYRSLTVFRDSGFGNHLSQAPLQMVTPLTCWLLTQRASAPLTRIQIMISGSFPSPFCCPVTSSTTVLDPLMRMLSRICHL